MPSRRAISSRRMSARAARTAASRCASWNCFQSSPALRGSMPCMASPSAALRVRAAMWRSTSESGTSNDARAIRASTRASRVSRSTRRSSAARSCRRRLVLQLLQAAELAEVLGELVVRRRHHLGLHRLQGQRVLDGPAGQALGRGVGVVGDLHRLALAGRHPGQGLVQVLVVDLGADLDQHVLVLLPGAVVPRVGDVEHGEVAVAQRPPLDGDRSARPPRAAGPAPCPPRPRRRAARAS